MKAKRQFTTMVIAAILFTFMGAGYVFAADYDTKGAGKEKTNKSMKMQSEKDSMKTDRRAARNYDNKSVLNKSSKASDLIGMTVKSKQNEDLGEVQDLIINQSGRIQYMVLSHGGLLGIGDDRIPIPFNDAKVDSDQKIVTLNKVDKQMLTNAPKFSDDDWNRVGDPQFDEKMRGFYGEDFNDENDGMNRMKQEDRMKQGDSMKQEDSGNNKLTE
jgi:sporulation protein YlmC with PRC-barrel domain